MKCQRRMAKATKKVPPQTADIVIILSVDKPFGPPALDRVTGPVLMLVGASVCSNFAKAGILLVLAMLLSVGQVIGTEVGIEVEPGDASVAAISSSVGRVGLSPAVMKSFAWGVLECVRDVVETMVEARVCDPHQVISSVPQQASMVCWDPL